MKWEKQGLIYVPESNGDWMVSHATFPVVDSIGDDVFRIFIGVRDASGYTRTTYLDVDADEPRNIMHVNDSKPVLGFGELGAFDDTGVHPSWIVDYAGLKYFYYTGWNAGVSVSYRNSIGLAISDDGGHSFTRMYKGPIVDRSKTEPHFSSTPCVLREGGVWRMWYLNGVRWELVDNHPEPICHIKYAESQDGIHWDRRGVVCIDLKSSDEGGIARPCVIRADGKYKMWYSYRGSRNYRTDRRQSYRIGYAESDDGLVWIRKDEKAGVDVADDGWDSDMIAYAYVYERGQKLHMIYCGNGFGRTGIGYAVATAH